MPRSVRDAIRKRITRLPYELRDLVATIAVAGRPVGIEVLSHIHGMSRLRLAALTDALVERHLVEEGEGAYRMAHPLLGAAVRAEITSSRRSELHRAMSIALELATRPERIAERAGEIAWHAERSGDGARAFQFALLASDHAVQHCGFDEALAWLDLARRAAPEGNAEIEGRLEKVALLAEAPAEAARSGLDESAVTIAGNDVDLRVANRDVAAGVSS
jgi:predicted ATPase